MRIVAGEFKGRTIKSPDEATTRPTTDRVRESMFSSILSRVDAFEDCTMLDAFGGSGALGIEGMSRGVSSCVFYEQDKAARRILEENLSKMGIDKSRASVRGADVLKAAQHSLSMGRPFNLLTLDPPYATPEETIFEFIHNLFNNGDLADDAVIVYEHSAKRMREVNAILDNEELLESTGQKKYGKIAVTYLRKREA